MNPTIDAPMLLPWLARRWKVSDARALELWRQACRETTAHMGDPQRHTSEYWGYARTRLIDLLDAEVLARYPVTETPWVMMGLNMLRLWAALRFGAWRLRGLGLT